MKFRSLFFAGLLGALATPAWSAPVRVLTAAEFDSVKWFCDKFAVSLVEHEEGEGD